MNVWPLLVLLLTSCMQTAALPSSPVIESSSCYRFLPLDTPYRSLEQPISLPTVSRSPSNAVHALFIDETILANAEAVGFDTIVHVLEWRRVNPAPGEFVWDWSDHWIEMALEQDFNLVLRLDMPPDWAKRIDEPDSHGLPFDLPGYADFVEAAATRYKNGAISWIVWNEPNLAAEWSHSGDYLIFNYEAELGRVAYPPNYAGVLGVAYDRIKTVDPEALVLAAGLAPTNEVSGRAMDDRLFLDQILAAGAGDCFDALAAHTYSYHESPAAAHQLDGLNLARIEDLRSIMLNHDLAEKPFWITELGFTVEDVVHRPVSLQDQADYLVESLMRVEQDWPFITLTTVWNLQYGTEYDEEMRGYSLLDEDGNRRPSWTALQDFFD
ncbi:MAG: hypothetical protein AB8G95_22200 [Anaerolineae bacterium]